MTKELRRLNYLYKMRFLGFCYENTEPKTFETSFLDLDFDALQNVVKSCQLCMLSKTRKNIVFGRGNPKAKLMIIGEAPGEQEDLQGVPFVGEAGKLLDKMLKNAVGLKEEDFYIANILKCRPPNNRKPQDLEANLCIGYLLRQIEIIEPKIIFCLGSTAFSHLLKNKTTISKARGKIFYFNKIPVLPSFHPSYLLRNPSAKSLSYSDCLLLKDLLEKSA